ncbi:RNA polymerase-associated protein CTR9, partial [Strigomonas culicis]
MSTSQHILDEALEAFSHGKVSDSEAKLDLALKKARAARDVNAIFDASCVRASIDAMSGKDVSHIFADVRTEQPNYSVALANYFEGLSLLSRGSFHSARIKFAVAKNKDRFFVIANLGLAAVSFQNQEYKECFAYYREVLGELGSDIAPPIVRVGMGLCAYLLNKVEYAVKVLERALEVHPNDELALLALFVVYVDERNMGKVSEIVERLSGLVAYNPLVWLKAGDLMYFKALESGNVKRYIQPLRKLLSDVRDAGDAEECALANFQEGRLLLAAGAYEDAKVLLKAALDCYPQMLAAEIHFARLLMLTGEHSLAVSHLQKINERYPNQKEVLQLLAARCSYDGNHESATQLAHLLISSVAQGDLQSLTLASWCFRLNSAECRRCTSNVINVLRSERKAAPWQLLANMASLNHDADGLQAILDRELDGDFLTKPLKDIAFVPLIFNLALELEKKDRLMARQLYLYLVKEQSCFAAPYIRLHLMAKEDGWQQQAVTWMTLLAKVVPEDTMALVYLAETYLDQGKFQAATKILRSAKAKSVSVALALGSTVLRCCQ